MCYDLFPCVCMLLFPAEANDDLYFAIKPEPVPQPKPLPLGMESGRCAVIFWSRFGAKNIAEKNVVTTNVVLRSFVVRFISGSSKICTIS